MAEEHPAEPVSAPVAGGAPAVPEAPATSGVVPGATLPELPGELATLPVPPGSDAVSERASDSDRDEVVKALRDHCVAGRLTLDEFSERTGSALAARTRGELDAVLADLPSLSQPPAEVVRQRRPRRWIVAVMGETESKLRWRLGGHTAVIAVMGQCHIDLSGAEIDGPEVVITALGIMGQIDIVAPEGIDVEVTGLSLMGRRSIAIRDVPLLRGSPRILVRAFPIMGEVNVKTRSRPVDQLPGSTP